MPIEKHIKQELDSLLLDLRNHNNWDNDNEANWEALIDSVVTVKEMLNGKNSAEEPKQQYNTDGGKNSYYDIDVSDVDTIDVDDISERYGFNHYEFNTLKALVGIAKWRNEGVSRHNGTSALRDAKKALYSLNRELLLVMRLVEKRGE